MDDIEKAIEEYSDPIIKKAFVKKLENLLGQAGEQKDKQPKNEQTRYWAVVYTQLENTLAYAKTYLGVPE